MSDLLQGKPIIITATMLRWFNMCHRRVWLDSFGDKFERDEVKPIVAYRLNEGVKHEDEVHAATAPNATQFTPKNWADGVRQTREFMEQGVGVIFGACLEIPGQLKEIDQPITLRGKVDHLARYRQPALAKDGSQKWIYFPIEIKVYPSVSEEDLLQLDLYIFILGYMQGVCPKGEFWLGRQEAGKPREHLPHHLNKERLLILQRKVGQDKGKARYL